MESAGPQRSPHPSLFLASAMPHPTLRLVTDDFHLDAPTDFLGDLESLLILIQRLQRGVGTMAAQDQVDVVTEFSRVSTACANLALSYMTAMQRAAQVSVAVPSDAPPFP